MKKLVLTLCAAITAIAASAQDGDRIFKPFKVDVAAGFTVPQGKGVNLGVNFAVEPKYAVMDQLAVGIRLEAMTAARNIMEDDYYGEVNSDASKSLSCLATADYYLSTRAFRPFVGGGLGMYKMKSTSSSGYDDQGNYYTIELPSDSKFGGMLRAGFEVWHFRCAAEYNIVGKTNYLNEGNGQQVKNGYFSLKVGMFIGGGKY